MNKLHKKNYPQMNTIEAYADCNLSCACYCAVCSCWGPDFLHISDTSANSLAQNFIPTATAQVR